MYSARIVNTDSSPPDSLAEQESRSNKDVVVSIFLRLLAVAPRVFWCGLVIAADFVTARLRGKEPCLPDIGERLSRTFDRLGGGFVKIGQILSTRSDILPTELVAPLRRLQDSQARIPTQDVVTVIERALNSPIGSLFVSFDESPIGIASIAQVHRAVLRGSGVHVAIKVRRPGIERRISADVKIVEALVRVASRLPLFRGIPILEATRQVLCAVDAQTDFRKEVEHHHQFFELFKTGMPLRVPRLYESYCSDETIVMEYFPRLVKITNAQLSHSLHRAAVRAGLLALYQMLFVAGLVHCDLHPGNILVDSNGAVVLLDFGFATTMNQSEKLAFAEFFLSIALNDPATAANIILQTSLFVSPTLDRTAFTQEIGELISSASGLVASDFVVAQFVAGLFTAQRKHGVYGSSDFTMAILSLVVYEGIIKECCPDMDFQREAIPILLAALAERGVATEPDKLHF